MNKKIIVLMLLLPLLLMISIFTSTKSVALNVQVAVTKIEIEGAEVIYLDLDKQEKYFINYSIYPVGATNKNVAFSYERVGSQDLADLEYVDGYLVPRSSGVAKVTLITVDGSFKDSFIVRVESKNLKSISCNVDNDQLIVGNTMQINTVFHPDNAVDKILDYSSSDTSVAAVDDKGLIRAVGKGSATIMIKAESNPNIYDTLEISVSNQDIMDLGFSEVNVWKNEQNEILLSVDTTENYEISYEVLNTSHQPLSNVVFKDGTDIKSENGKIKFVYEFVDNYLGSVIVKFTIRTDNPDRAPISKECIINKVESFTADFVDGQDALVMNVGEVARLNDIISILPADFDVEYTAVIDEEENTNVTIQSINNRLRVTAAKPGITTINVTIANKEVKEQKVELSKTIVILPSDIDINESVHEYGIEGIWTIGRTEFDGTDSIEKISLSIGSTSAGDGFWENITYHTSNENVQILENGTIKISSNDINELVEIWAKFSVNVNGKEISVESDRENPFVIRCISNGVNIRNFDDLYKATKQNKIVVLQNDIIDDFGKDKQGNAIYSENTITKIQSTYDITHYKNMGKENEAQIKILLNFKEDVYGNGFEINAHNVAYGLDAAGQLKQNALFQGPLNFVSMSESAGSLVSVKGQDNISFAVYDGVKLNNLVLKSCNLVADEHGNCDLSDLNYVGTTVEVFGDNIDIEYCRISNGRTVLRAFGDAEDSTKNIHVNIKNSVLSNSREFIIRMGSNCFVDGSTENISPSIVGSEGLTIPAQKSYENMNDNERLEYDSKYVKTFVNLKNSILKDAGLFCIGIDTHFAGAALADGKGLLGGRFDDLISSWYDLAKTSYGAKLTLEGDVRMYNWKDISSEDEYNKVLDSSTLIEIIGETSFGVLELDIKELIRRVEDKVGFESIITNQSKDGTGEYVHGGIAFFGGGKNYGVVEHRDHIYKFAKLQGYEVKLSDVGKADLQLAAGDESFYFLLNDDHSGFLPKHQQDFLNTQNAEDLKEAYAPIYIRDEN
ncbi:MAG: Ig domain-containing protein [Clostridia bacterium]|nr:Ig domain-containing protein [Clostridia bacterium]